MKKLFVLSFASIIQLTAVAQINDFEWAFAYGGPGNEMSVDLELDQEGNAINVGYFSDSITFDLVSGPYTIHAENVDGFIVKSNPEGQPIWVAQISGASTDQINSLVIDHQGNILVTGLFQGTCDFDPEPLNSYELTAAGSSDGFILKLNADGQFLWAKAFGGVNHEECNSIDLDVQGNILITGLFSPGADLDPDPSTIAEFNCAIQDVFIMKLDEAGNLIWAKQIASESYMIAYKIICDHDGNILISGNFNDTTDMDPGPSTFNITPSSTVETFILKLNIAGEFDWLYHNINAPAFDICVNETNDVFATGRFNLSVDFDPGTPNVSLFGSYDVYALRLSSNGVFQWVKAFSGGGTDAGNGIEADNYGNLYITGEFSGGVDFDPGIGTENILAASNSTDAFVLKLTDTGELIWVKTNEGAGNDYAIEIDVDDMQNIFVGGFSSGSPIQIGEFEFETNNSLLFYNDAYYFKIGTCASTADLAVSPCDYYTSPSGDISTTLSGNYTDVISNALGCDSIIAIQVDMRYSSTATFSPDVCGSFTSPSGNYTWTDSGIFLDTISNLTGCDSVMTFELVFINNNIVQNGQALSALQNNAEYQWLNCELNFSPIIGATESSFNVTSNGSYAAEITLNGCIDTSSCIIFNDIQVLEFADSFFDVYPNPASEFITCSQNSTWPSLLLVFDAWGQEIMRIDFFGRTKTIDISKLPIGIYHLVVTDKNGNIKSNRNLLKERL